MDLLSNPSSIETLLLTMEGDLSGERLLEFEAANVAQLEQTAASAVLVDMNKVRYLDSRGIALLIRLYKMCSARKLQVQFEVNPIIYRMLLTANLTRVLPIREANPQ